VAHGAVVRFLVPDSVVNRESEGGGVDLIHASTLSTGPWALTLQV